MYLKLLNFIICTGLCFQVFSRSGTELYLNVIKFGATGNGITDDYSAIQTAIDSAKSTGATVYFPAGVYNTSDTLKVGDGVTLLGEGTGATSTSTPYHGSIIKNTASDLCILITGQNSTISNLTIYNNENTGGGDGVMVLANNENVESVIFKSVLIYGFTEGTGLNLEAINSGGISYCSFYDLRVRHAKTGILINQDATSFINSNSFFHGVISGGGFDYCLRILSGNNNIFNGLIMEPYTSTYGHLIVEGGEIIGNNMRIEGTQQLDSVPLVEFKSGTANSIISGTYGGGLTLDYGDNTIAFKSGKYTGFKDSGLNLFVNSSFHGLTNNTVPFWTFETTTGITLEVLDPVFEPNNKVIKITIPPSSSTYFKPSSSYLQEIYEASQYDQVSFGAYIKTDSKNAVTTTCKSPTGVNTGSYHTGNGSWEFISMNSLVNRTAGYDAKFYLSNPSSSTSLVVYLSVPTLNFGNSLNTLTSAPLLSSGGIMTGTLTSGMVETTISSSFIVLPKDGNLFEINGTNTISRINHLTADRFIKGTVVTLIFNDASTNVTNSGYIILLKGYTSQVNSTLTLVSLGNGTWRELDRNE